MIIFLLVVLHTLFFIYLLFDETLWKRGVAGLVIIALYSIYRLIVSKTSEQKFYYTPGIFFLFMIFFSSLSLWLIALEGVLWTFCGIALQKTSVSINPFSIELKVFPFKKYRWSDLSNIVLKDNILTLDFKNNKLIQAEIDTSVNEDVFNAFAKEQLMKTL